MGVAFVRSIDEPARDSLKASGLNVLTLDEVGHTVSLWDWPKQDNAVQAMLHHIAHIEQDADATQRLLAFINAADPGHDSLVYFKTDPVEAVQSE